LLLLCDVCYIDVLQCTHTHTDEFTNCVNIMRHNTLRSHSRRLTHIIHLRSITAATCAANATNINNNNISNNNSYICAGDNTTQQENQTTTVETATANTIAMCATSACKFKQLKFIGVSKKKNYSNS